MTYFEALIMLELGDSRLSTNDLFSRIQESNKIVNKASLIRALVNLINTGVIRLNIDRSVEKNAI